MADYYQPSTTTGTGPTDQGEANTPTQEEKTADSVVPGASPAQESPPPAPVQDSATQTTQDDATPAEDTKSYDAMVDKLISQLGFEGVAEPQKSELVDAIKERIETRVLRVLMTSLTEEQTKALEEKIKAENLDEKAIIEFISREAPNSSAMIVSALDDLYMEMKQEVDTLTRAAGAQVADKQQQ